jgi:hypothetical protein
MSGRKTITYINFLQGIPAPIVALGGMIKVFLFYPLLCVTLQKIQPFCAPTIQQVQNKMTYYSSRICGDKKSPCISIVLIYLLYLTKDFVKKEDHHGEAVRQVQRHGYFKFSRPPRAIPSRWARRGPIRRILFNYLNRLRKKIISALIYFISFFSLLPTRSPQNRCDRAPLTSPSGSASRMIPPPSCLHIFGWLLCKIIVRLPPKPTI